LAYHLMENSPEKGAGLLFPSASTEKGARPLFPATSGSRTPFSALVIGPGGGRDLLTALVFGADRVEGVEVNPIIARDVMLGEFRDFSGSIYANPRVSVAIDDGRSYVRRSNERYDIIQ